MHLKSDRVLRVVCLIVMSSQELMLIFMTSNLSMLTFNQPLLPFPLCLLPVFEHI